MSRRRQRRVTNSKRHSYRFSVTSLILLGMLLGVGVGLYYAWIVEPVVYRDASPARFSEAAKAEYIYLVSQSYAADKDLVRARQRLAVLGETAVSQMVATVLEQFLREQRPPAMIRTLANLAQDLGVEGNAVSLFAPPVTLIPTATPTATVSIVTTETPTPTPSATPLPPTATPLPTPQPTATTQLVYRLINQEPLCLPDEAAPRIAVITWDALLEPLPGVEVRVQWAEGEDRFFTGFKIDEGLDYGDFTMSEGVFYTIFLPEGSPEVSGLRIEPCPETGLPGGWRLTFQNLIIR